MLSFCFRSNRSSIVAANEVDPKYLPVVVIEKYSDLSGLSYEEVIDVNLRNNNNEQPQGNEESHNVHEKSPTSSVDGKIICLMFCN